MNDCRTSPSVQTWCPFGSMPAELRCPASCSAARASGAALWCISLVQHVHVWTEVAEQAFWWWLHQNPRCLAETMVEHLRRSTAKPCALPGQVSTRRGLGLPMGVVHQLTSGKNMQPAIGYAHKAASFLLTTSRIPSQTFTTYGPASKLKAAQIACQIPLQSANYQSYRSCY